MAYAELSGPDIGRFSPFNAAQYLRSCENRHERKYLEVNGERPVALDQNVTLTTSYVQSQFVGSPTQRAFSNPESRSFLSAPVVRCLRQNLESHLCLQIERV